MSGQPSREEHIAWLRATYARIIARHLGFRGPRPCNDNGGEHS